MNKKSLSRRLLFVMALGFGMLSIQASQAQDTAKTATVPQVKFVTNMGEFVAEVYPDKAPKLQKTFCNMCATSTMTARFFTA